MSIEDIFVKLELKKYDHLYFRPDERAHTPGSFIAWISVDDISYLVRTYIGTLHLLLNEPENCENIIIDISPLRTSGKSRKMKFVTIYNKGSVKYGTDVNANFFTDEEKSSSYLLTVSNGKTDWLAEHLKPK